MDTLICKEYQYCSVRNTCRNALFIRNTSARLADNIYYNNIVCIYIRCCWSPCAASALSQGCASWIPLAQNAIEHPTLNQPPRGQSWTQPTFNLVNRRPLFSYLSASRANPYPYVAGLGKRVVLISYYICSE